MTTFEHALLGINGALAAGLHRHYGWKIVALAGVAAVAPDWDGLPMLIDMSRFEAGHRVWGHNLLACWVLGMLLGTADYRWDLGGRIAAWITRYGPLNELAASIDRRRSFSARTWGVWVGVAVAAALSQIPADAVVSGAAGLSDWALKPFWPFSDFQFVYPLVPWGNVGVTIVFSVAMIAELKKPAAAQRIALVTLAVVVVYIVAWGNFVNVRS
ncbi:metal-dependent hydrolase [Novipirellula caenicola]|uniref:Metal-dependent hydrolase n=1 Tax=Novipirellula caenicola TaxID=1536901 RepID=A0ABP9VPT9_9BACT